MNLPVAHRRHHDHKDIIFRKIVPCAARTSGPIARCLKPGSISANWRIFLNKIPGYYERLSAMLPSLIEHRCSYEERGGFSAPGRGRHLAGTFSNT